MKNSSEQNVESKANISTQDKDTGLPSYNPDSKKPYEVRNVNAGFNRRTGSSK